MKMWRKQAMKEGKDADGGRPGRRIRQSYVTEKYVFGNMPKTYPLLNALFKRAGLSTPTMITSAAALPAVIESQSQSEPEETTNETI